MKTSSTGPNSGERQAIVVSASRRYALISSDREEILNAVSAVKAVDLASGDQVLYIEKGRNLFITSILPRKNAIERSYRGEIKRIVTNLDRLFIVAAVAPLFSTLFIDRVLAVAFINDIPCTIILNKIDLGVAETEDMVQVYERLGFTVERTSAKFGEGIDKLQASLASAALSTVALCGVSGVGKSTILNRLIPEAERKIGDVSARTGLGRQTTTQAFGNFLPRTSNEPLLIIDLPGIQNFGVSHLDRDLVAESFPELVAARADCQFSDCSHIAEEQCGVKRAVEQGRMERFRYESYLHMLDEIEHAREY